MSDKDAVISAIPDARFTYSAGFIQSGIFSDELQSTRGNGWLSLGKFRSGSKARLRAWAAAKKNLAASPETQR